MPPKNETDGNGAAGTGGTPPATQEPQTPPAATPEAASIPAGMKLIKEEDYNNLISQRDKANNGAKTAEQLAAEAEARAADTDALVNGMLQREAVRDFLATSDAKEKYPDVTEAELLEANPTSDEQIEKFAEARQQRYEQVKQAAIKKAQRVEAPTISTQDRNQQLADLKKNKPRGAFQQALRLTRMQTSD